MSALAETALRIGLVGAVERIWEMVMAHEAADTSEAARLLWSELDLSPGDREFLGIHGLAAYASREQRASVSSGRPAIGVGAPRGKKQWDAYLYSLSAVYDDAEGTPKSLIQFTLTDWSAFAVRMHGLSSAYASRARLARKAEELLVEHGKTCAADLPPLVLKAFAAEAADVLRAGT